MNERAITILCVDERPGLLRVLERELSHEGWNVKVATSAREAVAAMKAEEFAVVISDAHLQGMSGDSLLHWVNERSPQTMRIMLTQYSEATRVTIPGIHGAGLSWFVSKPWDGEELRVVIREAVAIYESAADTGPIAEGSVCFSKESTEQPEQTV